MESVAEILAAEQKYFDHVSDHRERMRRGLLDAPGAAANAGAAVRLRKDAEARLQRIGEPDDAVAVGRMDDEDGDVLYVGYHTIFDDDSEVLVVNWQAPAASRYFTATHTDALGLAMKRSFDTTGNVIDAYDDTVFRQLAAAVAELEAPDDALLDDLNRDRTGQMHDIVRTIQAAQFDLIRAPLDEMLIIQGGPGTGKTAVALHRVSWLLFNYRGTLNPEDVLIVGPSPTFTRYTRTVLPSLGDTSVAQRDIGQFHPPVRRGRLEEVEATRLKGDGRMAGLLRRALYDRVGVASDQRPIEAQVDGRPVVFTADEINLFVARSRQTPGTFSQQRQIFRSLMVNSATERARERRLGVRTGLDQLIERVWPSFTAPAFLRDLFGSRDRLIAAAGEELTAHDIVLLHRPRSERISDEVWSEADLPLLDYLEALIHGIEERYGHIVVDEAQDLSPMQLRSIAMRSSSGSMTVVGDIAQSTGLWARDDWDDVLEHLPAQLPQRLAELKYGYRVPRQVFEIAAQLLPYAAPDVTAPQVVRDGPADPVFRLVDDESRAATAVEAAMAHASHGRSVAIICPAVHRGAIESGLTARDVAWRAASRNELGQGVNLVSPQEAKGLEFDATVVVEPKDIIAEDERGHRLLYVALTRTTRYLHIVGVLPPAGRPRYLRELEPIRNFELTQPVALPPAIGTATVHTTRAATLDEIPFARTAPHYADQSQPTLTPPQPAEPSRSVLTSSQPAEHSQPALTTPQLVEPAQFAVTSPRVVEHVPSAVTSPQPAKQASSVVRSPQVEEQVRPVVPSSHLVEQVRPVVPSSHLVAQAQPVIMSVHVVEHVVEPSTESAFVEQPPSVEAKSALVEEASSVPMVPAFVEHSLHLVEQAQPVVMSTRLVEHVVEPLTAPGRVEQLPSVEAKSALVEETSSVPMVPAFVEQSLHRVEQAQPVVMSNRLVEHVVEPLTAPGRVEQPPSVEAKSALVEEASPAPGVPAFVEQAPFTEARPEPTEHADSVPTLLVHVERAVPAVAVPTSVEAAQSARTTPEFAEQASSADTAAAHSKQSWPVVVGPAVEEQTASHPSEAQTAGTTFELADDASSDFSEAPRLEQARPVATPPALEEPAATVVAVPASVGPVAPAATVVGHVEELRPAATTPSHIGVVPPAFTAPTSVGNGSSAVGMPSVVGQVSAAAVAPSVVGDGSSAVGMPPVGQVTSVGVVPSVVGDRSSAVGAPPVFGQVSPAVTAPSLVEMRASVVGTPTILEQVRPAVSAPASAPDVASMPASVAQASPSAVEEQAPPVVSVVPAPLVVAPVVAATPAPGRGGTLAAQIIELAAAELAGQIRDNLQPAQWQAVVRRLGELLADE